jgi:hypothetical protein
MALSLVDYAGYNENFVLVVTSSCCIRWNSTGYQGRSPWLVRSEAKDLCFCDVILREVKDLCNLFVSDSQDANKKAQAVRRRRLY